MNGSAEPAQPQALTRILITADAVGGVWQYTIDLAGWLIRGGVSVLMATMGPRPSHQQIRQLPAGVHLVSSDYALEWSPNPWHDVDAAGAWLLALRDQFRPDLVHLNGYAHAGLAWNCPVLVVAHSCVFSWWNAVHGGDPGPEWNDYRRHVRAGLMKSEQVVTPSQFMAGEIALRYRVPGDKIRVIANSCALSAPSTPRKEPICVAAGRVWDGAKNFSVLRDAAGQIPWPVYLAGGTDGIDLQPVKMLGSISHPELLAWMARASIFVHPALYEPFGLAVLEAARAACCLVLSDTASARELWEDAAIFVEGRKPSHWVDVLTRLSADPQECTRRGRLAFQHSQRYTEARFRESYSELYSSLLRSCESRKDAAA